MTPDMKPLEVEDNVVVTMGYRLLVDGEIVETSEGDENSPVIFLQGSGQIVPGLEREIIGLNIGDKKTIIVSAEDGYGVYDASSVINVPRDEFPEDFPLEIGLELLIESDDQEYGEEMEATIIDMSAESITLDFNHPLAGKELIFEIEILDLRPASPEEIEHGHVHGDEEDFYFEEDDFDELEPDRD